jgi:hypothetical protein
MPASSVTATALDSIGTSPDGSRTDARGKAPPVFILNSAAPVFISMLSWVSEIEIGLDNVVEPVDSRKKSAGSPLGTSISASTSSHLTEPSGHVSSARVCTSWQSPAGPVNRHACCALATPFPSGTPNVIGSFTRG